MSPGWAAASTATVAARQSSRPSVRYHWTTPSTETATRATPAARATLALGEADQPEGGDEGQGGADDDQVAGLEERLARVGQHDDDGQRQDQPGDGKGVAPGGGGPGIGPDGAPGHRHPAQRRRACRRRAARRCHRPGRPPG